MPNLQDLRRRVRAVKNTQQITKAMKMVSAAKLRRAQERVTAARPYTTKMMQILGGLARRAPNFQHPLLTAREHAIEEEGEERLLLVLITADKGLCGAFNTNLIKAAQEFLRRNADKQIEMVLVGRKGRDFFSRRAVKVRREHIGVTGAGRVEFFDAKEIAQKLIGDFTAEEETFDRVYLIYNEFKSVLQQRVTTEQLLPIGRIEPTPAESGETMIEYLYEQPPDEVFGILLPKLIETQVFRALLESVASEHGARMTAMDSASKNANEVIDRLTLNMNRVRQAAITREIIEVVSGAGAL
jgi:F-type H+-transporting ATPase subunit gamma